MVEQLASTKADQITEIKSQSEDSSRAALSQEASSQGTITTNASLAETSRPGHGLFKSLSADWEGYSATFLGGLVIGISLRYLNHAYMGGRLSSGAIDSVKHVAGLAIGGMVNNISSGEPLFSSRGYVRNAVTAGTMHYAMSAASNFLFHGSNDTRFLLNAAKAAGGLGILATYDHLHLPVRSTETSPSALKTGELTGDSAYLRN